MLLNLEQAAFQATGTKSRKLKSLPVSELVIQPVAHGLSIGLPVDLDAYKFALTFDICIDGRLEYYRLGSSSAQLIQPLPAQNRSPLGQLKRLKTKTTTWNDWLKSKSLWGVLIEGETAQLISAQAPNALTAWQVNSDDKLVLEVVMASPQPGNSINVEWQTLPENRPESPSSGFTYHLPNHISQTTPAIAEALKTLPFSPDILVLPGAFRADNFPKAARLIDELPLHSWGIRLLPHLVRAKNTRELPVLTAKDKTPEKVTIDGEAYCILDVDQQAAQAHITAMVKAAKDLGFQKIYLGHFQVVFQLNKSNLLPNKYIDRLLKAITVGVKKDQICCTDLPPEQAIRRQLNTVHSPKLTAAHAASKQKAAPSVTAILHDAIGWPMPYVSASNNSLSLRPKSELMPLNDAAKYSYLLAAVLHSDWLDFDDPAEELQPAALQALPTLMPHSRPQVQRRISDSQSELYEITRNGLTYNVVFNFSTHPITIQLPDCPAFDPTDLIWLPGNHELRVPSGDARITLQVTDNWAIAGGSDHILPGCGVAEFEVDADMDEISISVYDSVPDAAQIFIRIPDDIDGAMVNGLFIRSLKQNSLNILRVDTRNCPSRPRKIHQQLPA